MKKQSFIKGSLILIASAVVSKAVGALFKIPLTNMLGGEGMGIFGCAYGLFLPIYAVTANGLTTAVAKLTAEASELGRYADIKRIRRTALLIFSLFGLFGSIAAAVFAKPFSQSLAHCSEALSSVLVIAPSVLFGCITAVYRGYCEGLCNMYPTALSQVAEALVRLFAGLGLCSYVLKYPQRVLPLLPKGTSVTAAAAAAAVLGISLSVLAGTVFMYIFHGEDSFPESSERAASVRSAARSIMKIFVPAALGAAAMNLTSLIDLFTIIRCLGGYPEYLSERYGLKGVGNVPEFIYGSFTGLALTVFNLVPSVTNMFGKGILPFISKSCAAKNYEGIKRLTDRVTAVTALIAVPCGAGICVLAEGILRFLFPSRALECTAAYQSLSVLGIAVIFLCLSLPLFYCFQASGRADIPVKITLAGAAVKLALNLLLIKIPHINILGAAYSTLLCYLCIFILCIALYPKTAGVKINVFCLIPTGFSGILCAVSARLCYEALPCSTLYSVPVSIAVGGAVYLAAAVLTGAAKALKSR